MKFSPWFAASRPARHAPRRPILETLEDRLAPAAYVVNRLGDAGAGVGLRGDIRYVIDQINSSAAASDTVAFSFRSGTTIRLTHGQLMINGGENVTIAGRGVGGITLRAGAGVRSSRILFVTGGATANVRGLTFSSGDGSEAFDATRGSFGGNIANFGSLTLTSCVVREGIVGGITGEGGGTAQGGGIYNVGTLTLVGSRLTSNLARGSDGEDGTAAGLSGGAGGTASGGGVYSTGALTLTNSTFADNKAIGGNGGAGADGGAGMDAGPGGSEPGTFGEEGGDGGAAGAAFGGGVYFSHGSQLRITGGAFVANQAISGRGGDGGDGGDGGSGNDTVGGGAGGVGGDGGLAATARGGGLAAVNQSASLTVVGTAFTRNFVQASASGKGGQGGDGGDGAVGGDGGDAAGVEMIADGWGGAVALVNFGDQSFTRANFTGNRVSVLHNTSAGNAGNGGNAGPSGDAGDAGDGGSVTGAEGGSNAWGGAIGAENSGSLTVERSSFNFNVAFTSRAGNGGSGGIGGQGDSDGQDGAGGFGGFGGGAGAAIGGAIGRETFIEGNASLTVRDSLFRGNQVIGGQAGDGGAGGAGVDGGAGAPGRSGAGAVGGAVADISFGPTTANNTFQGTRFLDNSAQAGNGGNGGVGGTASGGQGGQGGQGGDSFGAGGGAVFANLDDFIDFTSCTFSGNRAGGGTGGAGGAGGTAPVAGTGGAGGEGGRASFVSGGAVVVVGAEGVSFSQSLITGNTAQGSTAGNGGAGGQGGQGGLGGDGGLAGDVEGGGVSLEVSGNVSFDASDLTSNRVLGGRGGNGGHGGRSLSGPGGSGGAGGDTGGTFGGGLSAFGFDLELTLDGVNVASNQVTGGRAGDGGAGGTGTGAGGEGGFGGDAHSSTGGGVDVGGGVVTVRNGSTLVGNRVKGSSAGNGGMGGFGGVRGNGGAGGDLDIAAGGGLSNCGCGEFTSFHFLDSEASRNTVEQGTRGVGGVGATAGLSGLLGEVYGGGLDLGSSEVEVRNATVRNNTLTGLAGGVGGGGGISLIGAEATLVEVLIDNNSTNGSRGGGGLYVEDSVVGAEGGTIAHNTASAGPGGGVAVSSFNDDAAFNANETSIVANRSKGPGGGIYLGEGATSALGATTVASNTSEEPVGQDLFEEVDGAFTTNGNNFIGLEGGFTGIVDGVMNDRVGTPGDPVEPPVDPPPPHEPIPLPSEVAFTPTVSMGDGFYATLMTVKTSGRAGLESTFLVILSLPAGVTIVGSTPRYVLSDNSVAIQAKLDGNGNFSVILELYSPQSRPVLTSEMAVTVFAT